MIDLPPLLLAVWAGLVGGAIGSFLNVVIARVPRGESVVHPRSRCPRCETPIAWYDNVPLVSWLVLRGRCRHCAKPISWRYPLVELLGVVAGVLAVRRHGASGSAAAELGFVATLVALAFIDLDSWLLPHALTWPLMVAAQALSAFGLTAARSPTSSALGLVVGVGAFALVAGVGKVVFRREALGLGDVWFLGGLGAWMGVESLLPVVLLASLQGAAAGLVLLALGRGQPGPVAPDDATPDATQASDAAPLPGAAAPDVEDEAESDWVPPRNAVPFGPFLALGALEWLFLAHALGRAVPALKLFS